MINLLRVPTCDDTIKGELENVIISYLKELGRIGLQRDLCL